MLEKDIEARFARKIRALGGKAYKFESPGNLGVPDRLVCMPGGLAVFAELKAPGKKPRPNQLHRHRELRDLGFPVFGCVDSPEAVDDFIAWLYIFRHVNAAIISAGWQAVPEMHQAYRGMLDDAV